MELAMSKTIVVSGNLGPFKGGDKLDRSPAQCAYVKLMWEEGRDPPEECPLTTPQIAAVIENTDIADMEPDDADLLLVDAIDNAIAEGAGDGGTADDDRPITQEQATHRAIVARNLGDKLGAEFNDVMVKTLTALDDVKRGPVMVMDAIRAKWTADEIDALPLPYSSKPKGYNGNRQFDNYTSGSGDQRVVSNAYRDILFATPEFQSMQGKLAAFEGKLTGHQKAKKKTIGDRINEEVKLMRNGILLDIFERRLKASFPGLACQFEREPDKTPRATKYPLVIWDKESIGTARTLTVGQVKQLLSEKQVAGGWESGLDRAFAGGRDASGDYRDPGTLDAVFNLGIPRKKKGSKGSIPALTSPDMCLEAFQRLQVYGGQGGHNAVTRGLASRDESAATWVNVIGETLEWLIPVWEAADGPSRYEKQNKSAALERQGKQATVTGITKKAG